METAGHDLAKTIALLARTPGTLDALLRDLAEVVTRRNEGEGTWSAIDVVGHLIDGERTDWMPRTRILLESGESRTFEPFEREGHVRETHGKSLAELLDEFSRLRSENLAALRALNLRPEDLGRRGRHPEFGPVTLSQMLATWAAHDLTHLHQLSRLLAHPYREAVGPWSRYLGVMQCAGHSGGARPPAGPRLDAVHPVLGSRDVEASIRFYERLGFTPAFRDRPRDPRYAAVARDGVELHLQWQDGAERARPGDRPAYRFLVEDVDGLYAAFRASGAIAGPAAGDGPWRAPGDTPWGTREFHLRDADGNVLQFYRAEGAAANA